MMIKIAFGSVPKDGGTFTFYRNLRPALLEHGIDLRCVSVGKAQAQLWEADYIDNGCVLLAPKTNDLKKQAMAFTEWCEAGQVDVVIGGNSEAILSALPHLPERMRVLARCANGFDHGYRITLSGKERLARIIALTPRLACELSEHYGADPRIVHLIPNGIDPEPFEQAAQTSRGRQARLQLGFLGRLEHNQKGVFHLPGIVRELNARNISFKLRIAGKGRDRGILEKEFAHETHLGQVEFLGALAPAEIPQFLAATDIFIFTSHFEGCPNALLEALMAGCVPVAWLLDDITDFIITDDATGFVCPMGDHAGFAQRIQTLAVDRNLLQTMSAQAAHSARQRFTHRQAAAAYAALIKNVLAEAPPSWTPKAWSEFTGDPNFEHGWKDWLHELALIRWVERKVQAHGSFNFLFGIPAHKGCKRQNGKHP
jgi:glycosyltransferase involved in cell wall biosynthesis